MIAAPSRAAARAIASARATDAAQSQYSWPCGLIATTLAPPARATASSASHCAPIAAAITSSSPVNARRPKPSRSG